MTMARTKPITEGERNAQVFAGFAAGGAVGALIDSLLHPKTAGAQPGQVDLTPIEQALAAIIVQQQADAAKLDTLDSDLQSILAAIQALATGGTPPVPEDPVILWQKTITSATPAGTPLSTPLVDFRQVRHVLFKFESTLDQAVNLQVVGDIFNTTSTRQVNVGGAIALAAGDTAAAEPGWAQWYPWMGVQITVPVAPATGKLTIYYVRKNVD
jgi:hypothetical protein